MSASDNPLLHMTDAMTRYVGDGDVPNNAFRETAAGTRRPEGMDRSTEPTNVNANIELLVQAGELIRSGFVDRDHHPFGDDFVFHFFNPQLPDLAGDHHGIDGIARIFERLAERSEIGFRQVRHSVIPCGDELLVAFVTNTVGFDDTMIDVDAVVVWRVFDGQIHEAWDIPAINTVRPHEPLLPSPAEPAARPRGDGTSGPGPAP